MLVLLHVKSMATFLRIIFLSNISKVERLGLSRTLSLLFIKKIAGRQKVELEKVSLIRTVGLRECPLAEN